MVRPFIAASRQFWFLPALLIAAACTSTVSRQKLPLALTGTNVGDRVKVVTIPLPAIATSPNEGTSAGILTAFLLHNSRDEVTTIFAPQVIYSTNSGLTGTVYGAFYPSPDRSYEINISQSARIDYDYEFTFHRRPGDGGAPELRFFTYAFDDGSERFFGIGPRAPQRRESNYSDREIGFDASVAYEIAPHLQLLFGERFRDVDTGRGSVRGLPFLQDLYRASDVPGLDGYVAHAQRMSLIYSTLDSPELPTSGWYARATAESAFRALGNASAFQRYEAEIKGYVSLDDARWITVGRVAWHQSEGRRVPFLEQAILGGETTLRGYGDNRFTDQGSLVLNLEERIRLFRWEVFHVKADWELAPFIDYGAVARSLAQMRRRDFEFNPGIGMRALVRPNIVGRIDVGFSRDGPAVYVGLGYPF